MLSQWESTDRNTWAYSEPAPSLGKAFPRMAHREYLHGSSDAPDFLTGDETNQLDGRYEENDWARNENLFPESRSAQRPTQEQLQALKSSNPVAVERVRGQDVPSFDPNSPYFDPQQCWNEISQKYKCPYKAVCKLVELPHFLFPDQHMPPYLCARSTSLLMRRARTTLSNRALTTPSHKYMKHADLGLDRRSKSFNKKAAFVQHLRSANHSGTKFTCPSCKDRFDYLYALAAHVESPGRKCKINSEFDEHETYRIFLDQLTFGMVECGGIFNDKTQEFKLQDKFKALYDPLKTSGPTFGHKQVHGFESAVSSAASVRSDLTEAALDKHQQQLGRDGGRLAPSGRQLDNGPRGSGPEVALTAEALSRLQVQEKRASPWSQSHSMGREQRDTQQAAPPQQLRPNEGIEMPVPERHVSYRRQQFESFGWDTWDRGPVPRKEDQGRLANSKKPDWDW